MMETTKLVITVVVCLCSSGGVVIWFLNRLAKRADIKNDNTKAFKGISNRLDTLQDGLVMTLENDRVIFKALRSHEINGESEEQETKMDKYFFSLLSKDGGKE